MHRAILVIDVIRSGVGAMKRSSLVALANRLRTGCSLCRGHSVTHIN